MVVVDYGSLCCEPRTRAVGGGGGGLAGHRMLQANEDQPLEANLLQDESGQRCKVTRKGGHVFCTVCLHLGHKSTLKQPQGKTAKQTLEPQS